MSHAHGDAGGNSAAVAFILAAVAAVVIAVIVLAWQPWNDNGATPGQGGGDEPRQEQQVPGPQNTPTRQNTPQTGPQSTPVSTPRTN